jgi:membrane protein YdbS with pleckstrin-like domain
LEEFSNHSVSFDSLPKFELATLTPLNKDYLNVIYIGNSIFSILIAIGLLIFLYFNESIRTYIIPMIIILVCCIGLVFWASTVGFKKKGFALREKDIIFKKGILATTTTIIPFNRIQHVALHEGVLSRMYQLSELQIYTAGGSSSDMHISGLQKEEAERIKSFLLTKIVTPIDIFSNTEIELEKPIETAIASKEASEKSEPQN